MITTRTPEILAIKTCRDKASQPSSGKVHAQVFRRIVINDIDDNDNE
jgi:hypothetical protein